MAQNKDFIFQRQKISTLLLVSSINLTSQLEEGIKKRDAGLIGTALLTTLGGVPVGVEPPHRPPVLPIMIPHPFRPPPPPPQTYKPDYLVPSYLPPQSATPQNVRPHENYLKAPGLARVKSYYSEIGPNIDQGQRTFYKYGFETDNGINVHERAFAPVQKQEGQKVVEGSYSWYSPEGQHISVSYVADENGYRPIVTYHKK